MPLTSNFYGRKSNSNVYKSFKLESRERYTEPGTGTGAAAGVEWDHEQCLSSGWEKDIKINRVQIENNFGFDFLLYDDGRNEHRDKQRQRQRQAATGQRYSNVDSAGHPTKDTAKATRIHRNTTARGGGCCVGPFFHLTKYTRIERKKFLSSRFLQNVIRGD